MWLVDANLAIAVAVGSLLVAVLSLAISWLNFYRDKPQVHVRITLALQASDITIPRVSLSRRRRLRFWSLRREEAWHREQWVKNQNSGRYKEVLVLVAVNKGRRSTVVDNFSVKTADGLYHVFSHADGLLNDPLPKRLEPDDAAVLTIQAETAARQISRAGQSVRILRVFSTNGWGGGTSSHAVPGFVADRVEALATLDPQMIPDEASVLETTPDPGTGAS